jgi:exodeoxyribonuclease VII large subunit
MYAKSEHIYIRLLRLLHLRIENASIRFDRLVAHFSATGASSKLEKETIRLTHMQQKLASALTKYGTEQRHRLDRLTQSLLAQSPAGLINNYANNIKQHELKMRACIDKRLIQERHRLAMLTQTLELSNPERLLSAGYALVLKDGKVLASADDVHLDDELSIKMQGGQIHAYVTGKKKAN